MTPQGAPEAQRPLEVDEIARLEPAERRPRERLRPELEAEPVPAPLDHRQARAVHGDARADVAALERHPCPDAEPESGAGARERDGGPYLLGDPGKHSTSGGATPLPPPAPHRSPMAAPPANRSPRPRPPPDPPPPPPP